MMFFVLATVYFRMLRHALKDPQVVTVAIATGLVLLCGTVFYSIAEGWGVLDSLYFSVTTLTTIGFGDLVPTTPASKVFTIVYVFLGIGLIGSFITTVVQRSRVWQAEDRKDDAA